MAVTRIPLVLLVLAVLCAADARGDVFCLSDGSCIAGSSVIPLDDSFLRIQTLHGLVDIDRSDIVLHRPAAELKTYLEKARTAAKTGDMEALKRLAWWCRQKGLFEEMFLFFDEVLAVNPEDEDVQAFIDEMAATIEFDAFRTRSNHDPHSALELFRATAVQGPTLARIGEKILIALPQDFLTPMLLDHMDSRREEEKILALRILKHKRPEAALEPLIGTALFDRDKALRTLSIDALAHYEDDRIVYPFVSALRLKNRTVRLNALDALSRFADPRASGALIANLAPASATGSSGGTRAHIYSGTQKAAVTGFDAQVATSAALGNPIVSILQEGVTLDVKIFGAVIYTIRSDERRRIGRVLKDINGIDYGTDYVLWNEWWAQNRDRILGKTGS